MNGSSNGSSVVSSTKWLLFVSTTREMLNVVLE